MRILNDLEAKQTCGAGWLTFVFPVVIGFFSGGPAGAIIMAGTVIASTGAKNLEHLYKHHEIPTVDQIVN